MRWGAASGLSACTCVFLAWSGVAVAATPPDRNDPCAAAGRDSCGTTGVGFYRSGRYGVRWYGDFRGAVPGESRTFCIDLRFWYASPSYRYAEQTAAGLRNKEDSPVPAERMRRLAYALWNFGRSSSPTRQAAVMLYVHQQMGDARPGELDAAGLGSGVGAVYSEIVQTARRLHGPYRIQTRLAEKLTIGKPATATVRLLSASGRALPNARFTLSARGASGLASSIKAGDDGQAAISFTPTAPDLSVRLASQPVATSAPRIFVPTSGAGATNGQRLAAPASDRVSATIVLSARRAVTTRASAEVVRPGGRVFDRIRIRGLSEASGVDVELFGPFSRRTSISCTGRPYWQGQIQLRGGGEVRSPAVPVTRAGFYAFRERVTRRGARVSATTPCADTGETVLAAPSIVAGGDEPGPATRASSVGSLTPTSVSIPSLGIRARVEPVAIDVRHGTLGIPRDIRVAGWWRDGATPGSASGAVLIAGHVDSARAGTGAFFALRKARAGDRVQVLTAGRGTYTYRVVSVRSYPKAALPVGVYSSRGAGRLVLVTCGGPFDAATAHYADNVVVTAAPA
jgi:Sortase domain